MADPTLSLDSTLALRPAHLRELQRLIATHLPGEEVWAYGSRVDGTAHDTSDLDLVVRHPADLAVPQTPPFWELKEALSESNLPLLIDLHDWARLPAAFRENIAQQHIILHPPESLLLGETVAAPFKEAANLEVETCILREEPPKP